MLALSGSFVATQFASTPVSMTFLRQYELPESSGADIQQKHSHPSATAIGCKELRKSGCYGNPLSKTAC